MEYLRRFIRNWLGFSRTEVNGFLILLPLMILLITSEPAYRWWISTGPEDLSNDEKQLDSLIAHWNVDVETIQGKVKNPAASVIVNLFFFDPNKTSISEFQKLGFSDRLSKRIVNYREKGGAFRIKSDLLKIYGLDSTFYKQLYTYILLPDRAEKKLNKEISVSVVNKRSVEKFDLNQADTSVLKKVYGIGSKLAERIVKFRNGLGGFVSQDQLREVYGLDTTVVSLLIRTSFIANNFQPEKINMNTCDEKILDDHPYISKSQARAIISYRFQHGKFSDVNELLTLSMFSNEDTGKLMPYLSVTE